MGSKIPYGGCKQGENTRSVRCSILIFAHRMGYYPTLYFEDSKALFKANSLQSDDYFWAHYMPESKKHNIHNPLDWGLVIDMGCGTTPLSHAAMILGYTCFAFDNDASIIKDLVEPIKLSSEKRPIASKEKEHTRGVEEFVVKPLGNPFFMDDYALPSYAELEAQRMAANDSFDDDFVAPPRRERRKCDFVDDECEEDK
ncbi:hypothetical protein GOP47_0023637 [Adiantum capillus-veneris]|uniref:Uncharacterized protein n=1 Tax=Adiantum capillus-veneris TaxID=13818 RepID=A0A9D4Z5B3_ADICA|nr:hypothetical protein GOP47_0023637 [Adiantum capillus-veneris]